MPITYVEQLEQALAIAREHIADLNRRHEASEQAWAEEAQRQKQRIAWLEDALADRVVRQSKVGVQ